MELLEKNCTAIIEKYGCLIKKIEQMSTREDILMREAKNGQGIIGVKRGDRIQLLNSRIDPDYAAAVYAERYSIRLYGVYFIFGLSDGRHVRKILEGCDETNRIIVCEPDIGIFGRVCSEFDISDILRDKRVFLYIPDVTQTIDNILESVIEDSNIGIVDFCILPGYDLLYKDACESYMDSLIEKIRNTLVHRGTYMSFRRMIPQHTLYNMKYMLGQHNHEQLRRELEKYDLSRIPAIIVSAGPSLDKNVQELRRAQKKAFIIVVDAAVRTVLKAGVQPDMVCTIDPESPDRFFEGLELKSVNWSCIRLTRPWILEKYGERVFYYGFFQRSWNELLNQELGYNFPDVPSGGSVSSAAFMIAYLLGFKKLILVGQDMAFTNGISHTKGINEAFGDNDEYIKSRCLVQVEGNDGSLLDTDFQMWYYKQWFEKIIKQYEGEFEVINATEGGARIEGTKIMSLKSAIDRECTDTLDVYEIAQRIPPMFTGEQQHRLLVELKKMKNSIDEFKHQLNKVNAHQKEFLLDIKADRLKAFEIKRELKEMLDGNRVIEQSPIFDMIIIYAKKEEYEVGDDIYAKEDMGVDELVERSIKLGEGYLRAVEMLEEDFEEFVMKD